MKRKVYMCPQCYEFFSREITYNTEKREKIVCPCCRKGEPFIEVKDAD